METAVFGGGCFWCTEAIFRNLKGVKLATPGYSGGNVENPTYDQVCSGTTGHAEVIQIEFDPKVIPYKDLLDVFWNTHNPITLNRQGNDTGTQYRSTILYSSEKQKKEAEQSLSSLIKTGKYKNPIVTEIKPLNIFYPAEFYHQNYYEKNTEMPYCQFVISPKLKHLREKYADKLI